MIKKIVVDGNDGTGKSTRVNELRKLFPNIPIEDRGIFSEATLDEELFKPCKKNEVMSPAQIEFRDKVAKSNALYIITDADPETCQKRIIERGDSIDVEFHNMKDLKKYRKRFWQLINICDRLPNVMVVVTD